MDNKEVTIKAKDLIKFLESVGILVKEDEGCDCKLCFTNRQERCPYLAKMCPTCRGKQTSDYGLGSESCRTCKGTGRVHGNG